MDVLSTLVRADPWRKTRLHDMKGNMIDLRSYADIPRVVWGSLARERWGYRPALPWIPYTVLRHLQKLVRSDWRVLEFGAGMSTIWFAERCQFVQSIESNGDWVEKVKALLERRGLTNVRLEHRNPSAEDAYVDLAGYQDASFDFVLIDAYARARCVAATTRLVKPGGWTYLDNTDFGAQWEPYAHAEKLLLEAAARVGGKATFYTGFAPAQCVANQGLLVEWPGSPLSR